MPVSKSKKRAGNKNARAREELKRVNRLRGQIGNMDLKPHEAKIMFKALKDRSTPIQYLDGTRDDINSILDSFNLITDTRDYLAQDEKFQTAFKQSFGTLYGRVVDAAGALDEFRKGNKDTHEQYREEMEDMGNVQLSENWIACLGPIEAYDQLRHAIEEVTLNGIGYVLNDIIKATHKAGQAAAEQEVVLND